MNFTVLLVGDKKKFTEIQEHISISIFFSNNVGCNNIMVILQSKIATTHLFLCFICCFLSIALLFNIIESCSILLVGTMCLIQFPDSLLVIFRDECISWLLVLLALRSKLSKKWISSWAQASWAVNWKSSSLQLFSFAHLASVCLLFPYNNK